jgi:hypothetical protein
VAASLNLPFLTVFPINFMLMLFVSLFMLDKLQNHEGLEGFRGDLYTERPLTSLSDVRRSASRSTQL